MGDPHGARKKPQPPIARLGGRGRSVLDLPVKSVLKKWKDKGFAAGVDRTVIEKGAALMEVPPDQRIADTIEGMKTVAETIGLKGNPDISPSA